MARAQRTPVGEPNRAPRTRCTSLRRHGRVAWWAVAPLVFLLAPAPGSASGYAARTAHLMQVERVLVGVGGDPAAQAIQLRMRGPFQNELVGARLVAHDAAGANPVLLLDLDHGVAQQGCGVHVLAATAQLAPSLPAPLTPDFTLASPIPSSYFAAGSLTYEDDAGGVLWRLSWGGASYTGDTTGLPTNDADGEFGPPYPGRLRSSCAVELQPSCSTQSTSNAADYVEHVGVPVLTDNAGTTAALAVPALATVRNGSGVNPPGFQPVGVPLVGATWSATVDVATPGAPASLLRVFLGGPLAGIRLGIGELLCAPPSLPNDIATGVHTLSIPPDCTLIGATFCVQAATLFLSPVRLDLQNAIDLRIGTI